MSRASSSWGCAGHPALQQPYTAQHKTLDPLNTPRATSDFSRSDLGAVCYGVAPVAAGVCGQTATKWLVWQSGGEELCVGRGEHRAHHRLCGRPLALSLPSPRRQCRGICSTAAIKAKVPLHPEWSEIAKKELRGKDLETLTWNTPEGIAVKPVYTKDDAEGIPHELSVLGGLRPYDATHKASSACPQRSSVSAGCIPPHSFEIKAVIPKALDA